MVLRKSFAACLALSAQFFLRFFRAAHQMDVKKRVCSEKERITLRALLTVEQLRMGEKIPRRTAGISFA